jgi:hypothetical protein
MAACEGCSFEHFNIFHDQLHGLEFLLEKLIVTQLVNKFYAYYGAHMLITIHTRDQHQALSLSHLTPVHIFTACFLKNSF